MSEDTDTKQIFWCTFFLALVLCSLIWATCLYNYQVVKMDTELTKDAMEWGYIEIPDTRNSFTTLWVKKPE